MQQPVRPSSRTATDSPIPQQGMPSLDLIGGPMAWQERGLCQQTDPEVFWPEKGGSTREAKKICSRCEVRPDCLQYALDHDERTGIWGGLSELERRPKKTPEKKPAKGPTQKKTKPHLRAEQVLQDGEKRCRRCGEVKRLEHFARRKQTLDGHVSACRPCAAHQKVLSRRTLRLAA